MKVLFTTPVLGYPAIGGPQLRIKNTIKALNQISELHIVSRVRLKAEAENYYKSQSNFFLYTPQDNKLYSSIGIIRKIQSVLKEKIFSHNEADYIIDYADKYQIKIIWCGYGNISYDLMKAIKKKRPDLKVICDTDSVWSRFVLRELPYESDPQKRNSIREKGRQKEKEEKSWVKFCDITTGVSDIDMDFYKSIADDKSKIALCSNVIDPEDYNIVPPPPEKYKTPNIYLAGTFWKGSPMEKSARWVIEEIFPLVKKEIPQIHFYILGKNSDVILDDISDPNITITGTVRSALPYLFHANVAIVPLTFESGTRFKILEAGGCGVPIVSTTLGAEGIPVMHEKHIMIADDALAFAKSIIALIKNKDKAKALAANCRMLVEEKFSIESHKKEIQHIINKLHS